MKHPDLAAEQSHLDDAYRHAERMRARAAELSGRSDLASNEVDAQILEATFLDRAAALAHAMGGTLCFGRIDDGPERLYIGRIHVEDEAATPLVVDWRARAAIPFYRATLANPMGLDGRRRFVVEGRELIDILEEDFNDPESAVLGGGGVPDPLLAELGRARTGRMRDIVATIQSEQDEVIRAPLAECLIVQGGPGTGKTAVGLHRAAFLLYEHRERLLREGVLVVGPNPLFLDYISQVLPTWASGR
jgi:DNA helicase IV